MTTPVKLHFGTDLVDQAASHIAFLKAVDGNHELRRPEVLKRALYRYEKLWLPLAAEHPSECLSAPMDIEWLWHCHMLSPKSYEKDCNTIVHGFINHAIRRADDYQRARNIAHAYWSHKYGEPFYIDQDTPDDANKVAQFSSRISYDIAAAADRQRVFFYQVSLPHYQDRRFLESALHRYKQFLYLRKQHPEEYLVPCYDIDLIWHTHQLNPMIYKNDIKRIVGNVFNHDDSVNDRREDSKLNNAHKRMRELWSQVYNESFSKFGAMYRGNPPNGQLYSLTQMDEYAFCTKHCIISVDQLNVHMPSPELNQNKNIILKASSAKASQTEVSKWFTLKRPSDSRPGNPVISWSKVGSFTFDTQHEHGVLFTLQQKSGVFSSKSDFDSSLLNLIPQIESPANAKTPGGRIKVRVSLKGSTTLDFHGHFEQPKIGDALLFLEEGVYEDEVDPDDVHSLLGPVALETLHSNTDRHCKTAMHTLKTHLGYVAFKVRMLHSTSLVTSVIQVLYQDKISAIAHLIAADQLPLPTQVNEDNISLNPKQGERAVLIKNDNGDWGIVCGCWTGLKRGVPPTKSRRGIRGSPGTLRVKFYKTGTSHVQQTDLAYTQTNYTFSMESAQADLMKGFIQIDPQSNEVSENIALSFAVSLLHVLCVPRGTDWKEGEAICCEMYRGNRTIDQVPSDKMKLVRAAGLVTSTASNQFLRNTYGDRNCVMCGGGGGGDDEGYVDIDKEWDGLPEGDGDAGYCVSGVAREDRAGAGCGGCGGCGGGGDEG